MYCKSENSFIDSDLNNANKSAASYLLNSFSSGLGIIQGLIQKHDEMLPCLFGL